MFEKYHYLRDKAGVTDYAVSKATGVSRSTLSEWGRVRDKISQDNLERLADYFHVPVAYFFGDENEEPTYYLNEETAKKAQELFENPDMRMLFDAARDSRPEDLQMAADLLKRLKGTNPNG